MDTLEETKRRRDQETKWKKVFCALRLFVFVCLLCVATSCTYNSGGAEPSTLRDKQDQAVRDPINYKPDNENTQPYDISGGGINNLDKNALKKDLHNVFDP